jgi:hypothetical protein
VLADRLTFLRIFGGRTDISVKKVVAAIKFFLESYPVVVEVLKPMSLMLQELFDDTVTVRISKVTYREGTFYRSLEDIAGQVHEAYMK